MWCADVSLRAQWSRSTERTTVRSRLSTPAKMIMNLAFHLSLYTRTSLSMTALTLVVLYASFRNCCEVHRVVLILTKSYLPSASGPLLHGFTSLPNREMYCQIQTSLMRYLDNSYIILHLDTTDGFFAHCSREAALGHMTHARHF